MGVFILKIYMQLSWLFFKNINYSIMNKLYNKYNLYTLIDLNNKMSFKNTL